MVAQHLEVLGGELVFARTRVPAKSLFDHLEAGDSIDQFLEAFPSVKREQIIALLKGVSARRETLPRRQDTLQRTDLDDLESPAVALHPVRVACYLDVATLLGSVKETAQRAVATTEAAASAKNPSAATASPTKS